MAEQGQRENMEAYKRHALWERAENRLRSKEAKRDIRHHFRRKRVGGTGWILTPT